MVEQLTCAKCGSPMQRPEGAGRPPTYCSETCRRLIEYEIRRIDRRLAKYEDQLREEHADRNAPDAWIDNLGRTRTQRLSDLRKWIREDEQRLAHLTGRQTKEGNQ